ncbi:MAG TPA: iron-sulfur cluster co-chaperone HscB C-terminal domain-containing protein [Saprospiraceae bacterium]|nr:iron-sulfur cluster co-chaperone HscB C-terminal domain-containing protein [Saprospiraceae bacterium]
MNYFEFFGLPVSFFPDQAALRRAFLLNSKKYHPDFHTLADEGRQAEMLEQSTLNNQAYHTLSNPDLLVRYVLEIKGLLGEEGNQPALPQDFLMEVMDINEGLMELEMDFDPARFADTNSAVDRLEQSLDEAVKPVLDAYTDPEGDPSLSKVADYFFKKRYLLRIRENLSKFAAAF